MVLLSSLIRIASTFKATSLLHAFLPEYTRKMCLETIYSPLSTLNYFVVPHLFDIVPQKNHYHQKNYLIRLQMEVMV